MHPCVFDLWSVVFGALSVDVSSAGLSSAAASSGLVLNDRNEEKSTEYDDAIDVFLLFCTNDRCHALCADDAETDVNWSSFVRATLAILILLERSDMV